MFAAQVVIDYPTPAALSQFITRQLLSSGAVAAATAATPAAAMRTVPATAAAPLLQVSSQLPALPMARSDALAVLASAARSPAGLTGPGVPAVHDLVGLVSWDRWDIERPPTASSSARWVAVPNSWLCLVYVCSRSLLDSPCPAQCC